MVGQHDVRKGRDQDQSVSEGLCVCVEFEMGRVVGNRSSERVVKVGGTAQCLVSEGDRTQERKRQRVDLFDGANRRRAESKARMEEQERMRRRRRRIRW